MLNWYLNDIDECVTSTYLCMSHPFPFPRFDEGMVLFLLVSVWRDTFSSLMVQKHGTQAKMEGFCSLFLSQSVVANIICESLKFAWKEIHWSSNFTPVFKCSTEISHTLTGHTHRNEWGVVTCLGCMHAVFSSLCAHSSEQLAVCKGSRKTILTIFTWWRMVVNLSVSGKYSKKKKTFQRRASSDSTTAEVERKR